MEKKLSKFCPALKTSTVTATSGETSRKRTADVEPAADVPSASRRRRNANTDASSYIRPTFPSCCVNGVVEQTCLIPSSPGYDPTAAAAVQPPTTPIYGPQVIAPQIHAQLASLPSTSIVHNVTPIALHLHGPPSVASNYAYFLPHPAYYIIQPLMGLRLPTTPLQYVSQDIPFADRHFLPPLINDIPDEYSGIQRSLDEMPVPQSAIPSSVNAGNNWDHSTAHFRLYPGFSYLPRAINAQMESVASRVRIAQAAAQVGVDPATATQMLANRARHPIDYYADNNHNSVPLVEGPVAVPTMAAEWMPQQTALQSTIETVSAASYHQQLERLANGEIPFRAWEAAVLHIFDRMAPQMNAARLPPKGMTKNEIDQLKSFRVTDPALLMEKVCVICQCDFEKRDLVRMLPCAHHFHLKCIDKWLRGNRTCPICRQNAAPDEDDTFEVISGRAGRVAAVVTGTSGTSGGAGAENTPMEENGDHENPRAAVQVITQMRGTPEPADGSFHDSRY
uniref:RING-type domain-containing protein n=1 Tax=Loa loa TaxID=7209 RepID=A0A1I7VBI5_LOALO